MIGEESVRLREGFTEDSPALDGREERGVRWARASGFGLWGLPGVLLWTLTGSY